VHEAAINNGFVLEDNLVAEAALKALLITVAFMVAILDLLKVPYDTEFANCGNKMLFLLSILCYLRKSMAHRGTQIRMNAKDIEE
jgi:hypothetical protein